MKHPTSRASFFPRLAVLCLLSAFQPFSPSALSQQASAPVGPPTLDDLDEDIVEMSVFNVTETRTDGYDSRYTTSGMRTSQELKNVPSSLSIVNSTFISDVGALDTAEMSKWFVTGESNPEPGDADRPIFRGVQSNYPMRNGWIWYSGVDSYAIERVEIVRGPNSFLFGESEIGGISNTITKQGLFKKDSLRVRLFAGSYDMFRTDFDLNKMVNRYVAIRAAGVYQTQHDWFDFGSKEFMGMYAAVTIRPTKTTTIRINGEVNQTDRYVNTGLFIDGYSYSENGSRVPYNMVGGLYTPADGRLWYVTGNMTPGQTAQKFSAGSGLTLTGETTYINQPDLPKHWQFKGPDSHQLTKQASVSVEIEQQLGPKLTLMLSGNFYQRAIDDWTVSSKTIYKDVNEKLPDGTPNPRYNEYYAEYFRQHQLGSNIVRDLRASLVYNWDNFKWIKQQFVFNVQQHQDNPGQKDPKLAEYVHPSLWSANDQGILENNQAANRAAVSAVGTAFRNNRFYRRYYLSDGASGSLTADRGPVPGTSAYYPDYGGNNSQFSSAGDNMGSVVDRRFYTPSYGIGAAGTYFGGHLFTLLGYRKDKFKMREVRGAPEVYSDPNSWNVRPYDDGSGVIYTDYTEISRNAGVVVRFNDHIALNYNYGQSARLSLLDGRGGLIKGTKQGLPTGRGHEAGLRLAFKNDSIVFNATYYNNFQPNNRVTLSMSDDLRNALADQYENFDPSNDARGDTQKLTTQGVEIEFTANITKNWRVLFNYSYNKLTAEDRVPQLKYFYGMAKDNPAFAPGTDNEFVITDMETLLETYPDGDAVGGYTKNKANIYTRYDFRSGALKGLFLAGGANWRDKTYRGFVKQRYTDMETEAIDIWGPAYTIVSVSFGYTTRIFNRKVSFQVNIDNLLDKEYYRSGSIGSFASSGSWGEPRAFKFITYMDF